MNIDRINVGGNLYDVCDTNARAMISDEYNSATQYSAGDYCIWENTLKKANKSTTGTYDHTAWDDTNIGEVVGELNQNMFTKVTPAANDANGCLTSGMYYVGENWSNLPVNYGILIVFSVENYCVQLFRCVVDSSRSIYSRTSSTNGSTWSEWVDHQGIQ